MLDHFFITFTCIPSGPLDLFHFVKLMCVLTSSSVIVKSLSEVSGVGPGMGISLSMRSVFVMTLVKKTFNAWDCLLKSWSIFLRICLLLHTYPSCVRPHSLCTAICHIRGHICWGWFDLIPHSCFHSPLLSTNILFEDTRWHALLGFSFQSWRSCDHY